MSIICLNCRGLGDIRVVKDLRNFLRRVKFNIVFVAETKLSGKEMVGIKNKLGNYFGVYVDSRGRVGGFVMLWDKE